MNFIPKMKPGLLLEGYRNILQTIYSQKAYFERLVTFFREFKEPRKIGNGIKLPEIRAFLKAVIRLGVLERGRRYFWRLLIHVIRRCPESFGLAVDLAIRGFHYRRITASII
jgi:hypothetical protein